ncbi:beta/alpha barrel domain-containing protein [Spirabiliibacterium falconis]|uniref:ribulose phosphate epimerase n=1 Tax=Spirabiliibacterium falconis TaxID=572023 RepID=UPI001AAD89A0|nr:ribulose phosphate epimerase [Spirabiliibacterium falconis]MBE2893564.1 ribulose phosphate epimerase [Spirabiliibacterium falconis]
MENKFDFIQKIKFESISAGILSSDWLHFADTLSLLNQSGINLLHFDIADGSFSRLFTAGPMVIPKFPNHFYKDVHLLTNNQCELVPLCLEMGANIITLQVEKTQGLLKTLKWLSTQYSENKKVISGVSLCPTTNIEALQPYLQYVDLIQILSLDPRNNEKASIDFIIERISLINQMISENRENKIISVDGSMTLDMAKAFYQYDIDWIVSGSALFSEADLYTSIMRWKQLI